MPTRCIFADESGDFVFTRGNNISRFFLVCTVTMKQCEVGNDLLELRRELAWKGAPLGNYFHATTDKQIVRDAVFERIADHDFEVQATIVEKSKAQQHVRSSAARFYQYGWFYHFKHGLAPDVRKTDELMITAASIATRKRQGAFKDAVNDVVQQHLLPTLTMVDRR